MLGLSSDLESLKCVSIYFSDFYACFSSTVMYHFKSFFYFSLKCTIIVAIKIEDNKSYEI